MATFNSNPAWYEPITSFIAGSLSKNLLRRRHNSVRFDAEFLQQVLERRRCAEAAHADHLALEADVTLPAKRGSHFHGYSRGYARRKNALLVGGILTLEKFP